MQADAISFMIFWIHRVYRDSTQKDFGIKIHVEKHEIINGTVSRVDKSVKSPKLFIFAGSIIQVERALISISDDGQRGTIYVNYK